MLWWIEPKGMHLPTIDPDGDGDPLSVWNSIRQSSSSPVIVYAPRAACDVPVIPITLPEKKRRHSYDPRASRQS